MNRDEMIDHLILILSTCLVACSTMGALVLLVHAME